MIDVAAARNLLGIGVDAEAATINNAFHAAVGRLDPIDPSYQRRIDQLIDARASLLWKPEDAARGAVTLPPEDIVEQSGADDDLPAGGTLPHRWSSELARFGSDSTDDDESSSEDVHDFATDYGAAAPIPTWHLQVAAAGAGLTLAIGVVSIFMRPHAEDGLADTLFLLRGPAVWVADVLHWAAPVLVAFGAVLLVAVIPLSLARRTLGRWLLKGHIAASYTVPAFASIVLVIGLMNVALVVAVGVVLIVAVLVAIFGWLEGL